MQPSFRQYRSETQSHSHDGFHQVIIADHGVLDLEVEGRGGRVAGHQIAFVPAGDRHAYHAVGMNRFLVLDVDVCDAAQTGIEALWDKAGRSAYLEIAGGGGAYGRALTASLGGAIRAFDSVAAHRPDFDRTGQPKEGDGKRADRATYRSDGTVAAEFLRQILLGARAAPLSDVAFEEGVETSDRLVRAAQWALMRLDSPVSVAEMARIAALSESAFFAAFQRHFGQSPMRWLGERRLLLARDLIIGGVGAEDAGGSCRHLSFGEVARRVGFADQSAFSRAFTRRFGHAPSKLRRCGQ